MLSTIHPIQTIRQLLDTGALDKTLSLLYGCSGNALVPYRARIHKALDDFIRLYAQQHSDCKDYEAIGVQIFSVSGRTELGGNHTDHQHGSVLAAGVSLDILAVAAPIDTNEIYLLSEDYAPERIALSDLDCRNEEQGTSAALIRGTAARFAALGQPVGGFIAYMTSAVLKGSGLSSSAAFEVMIGTICNDFSAQNRFSPTELAMIAQYAENVYFGKPCGLMDQMACALGGVVAIDFADPQKPQFEQVTLDLTKEGYALCIIDTGGDHADLTDEYAAIPAEMKAIAKALGADVLRDTDPALFWSNLPKLRTECGDRAVMRAIHFYADHARVSRQIQALKAQRFDDYLSLVTASGRSSVSALQNIYACHKPQQQAVSLTLALCEQLLAGKGAYRVHGGGFAGTVQAYVPLEDCAHFCKEMNAVLGENACHVLAVRAIGATALLDCVASKE
ncbi:MAG: galactokinase [Oscillospiraceae bacterium]|nr:galactokinase [Oscillospiraceae bacterium]